jgi:hypothetical protein
MKTSGKWRYGSTCSLPRDWMAVSGEPYVPDQDRTVHQVGVWMGLRASFDSLQKGDNLLSLAVNHVSIPGRSSRLPGHHTV